MSSTWIILVNWNGGGDTVECLESLLRLSCGDFSVIIVDNGSSDDSLDRIDAWARAVEGGDVTARAAPPVTLHREADPLLATIDATWQGVLPAAKILLVRAGKNLGFAAANNLGMALASRDGEARFFWLLNNDTIVAPDALAIQHRRMTAEPDIDILGARLMYYDAPQIVQGLAGGFHFLRARGYHIGAGRTAADMPDRKVVEKEMAYVMGASMFVRRRLLETIGGMAEDYFLYFEEIDWARRMVGEARMGIAPEAVVWHKEGGSIGTSSTDRPSDTALYYLSAGLLRFYIRHLPLLIPLAICRILRNATSFALKGDRRGARAMLTAIKDVARGRCRRGHYGSHEFLTAGRHPSDSPVS